MFGIGPEFLVIVIVALVLIGPAQLPEIMKTIGKGINEFRRMSSDVKSTLEREIARAGEIKRIEEIRKELFDDQPEATELQQEAAEAHEAAAKLEAESVKPVVLTPAESVDLEAQAEALKLVDNAKAEAAKLIANAQAEANKLLETAEATRLADTADAKAPVPADTVEAGGGVKHADSGKTEEGLQGKTHA